MKLIPSNDTKNFDGCQNCHNINIIKLFLVESESELYLKDYWLIWVLKYKEEGGFNKLKV